MTIKIEVLTIFTSPPYLILIHIELIGKSVLRIRALQSVGSESVFKWLDEIGLKYHWKSVTFYIEIFQKNVIFLSRLLNDG